MAPGTRRCRRCGNRTQLGLCLACASVLPLLDAALRGGICHLCHNDRKTCGTCAACSGCHQPAFCRRVAAVRRARKGTT